VIGAAGPARLPAAEVATSAAVRLFVERAQAALPDFRLTDDNAPAVAEICRRLDGIPLALELAAARVGTLTVDLIAQRLGDRFRLLTGGSRTVLPRHRRLSALLDWSHDLLSLPERLLFRRLAVFAGGWTLEAAEAVGAGDGVEPESVLDLLAQLVDKSLVLPEAGADGVGRYRLLETVREYARERLEAGEAAAVRRRHAAHYLALAERAGPELRGPTQMAWLPRLDAEHDNLRAALRWALQRDEIETGLRLSGALDYLWAFRGRFAEGRAWLEAFLARAPGGTALAASRAKANTALGHLARLQGDYAGARASYEQSLALWQAAGDRLGIAQAVHNLGEAARGQGDYVLSVAHHEEALRLHRELGHVPGIAASLNGLGVAAHNRGEVVQAEAYFEEALVYYRRWGDRQGPAIVLNNLADLARSRDQLQRAATLQEESLALRRELGDRRGVAMALKNLADIAYLRGDPALAATRLAEAVDLHRRVGSKDGVASCLEAFARVAVARRPARAARLLGAAEALREAIGAPLRPADCADRDASLAAARRALGAGTLAALGAAGRSMTSDQAIAYALAAEPPAPAAEPPAPADGALTPRQREVAALVARGRTNRQIAAELVIAERTAETHVDHILTRLGFTCRAQIAAWVAEQGPGAGR
jgi:non-specific serine/threonine protein kinase